MHCTALTKGEKFLHNKISYEIYSEAGTYHKQHGIENQDAIKVGMKDDYFFCAISDGCGSSKYAKQAAEATVKGSINFCEKLLQTNLIKQKIIELPYILQNELQVNAKNANLPLSELKSTLILFILNIKTKRYYIAHIGDGVVIGDDQVLSYPENGITNQFTYFVNQENILEHFRLTTGVLNKKNILISTDGLFDSCYSTCDFIERSNEKRTIKMCDDVSYCELQLN